jgi:hypothetical protein
MSDTPDVSLATDKDQKFYYLKAVAHPASPNGRYAGRYVRYTGSISSAGTSDVVLTEARPIYLRFCHEDGKSLASFKDVVLGFKMKTSMPLGNGLRAVEMFKNQEPDHGFYFDRNDGDKLKWKDEGPDSEGAKWSGWFLRDCPPEQYKGNPQLFWASSTFSDKSSDGLEKIDLVAEYI